MLDVTSIQPATPSKDAASQNARKSTTQSETGAAGRGFESEYEAAAPQAKKENVKDVEPAGADEIIAPTPAEDEGDTGDIGVDITADEPEIEEMSVSAPDGPENLPLIAPLEPRKAIHVISETGKNGPEKRQLGTSTEVQPSVPEPKTSRQSDGAKETATPDTTPAQKSNAKGATAAETIVMTKAAEQASKTEASSGPAVMPVAEQSPKQAGAAPIQSQNVAQFRPLTPKEQIAGDASPGELRMKRSEETRINTADSPVEPRRQPVSTNTIPFSVKPGSPQTQPLSKPETNWDKAELLTPVPTELENVGAWDTRAATHTSTAALSQILSRADTPPMIARQMAEALQKLPDRPVEISLNPSELGRVRMTISAAEAGITVGVLAERPETLDLMRRNIEQLTREFQSLGYENISFTFSEGQTRQGFEDDGSSSSGQSASKLTLEPENEVNTPPPTLIATSGVDIRL